MRISGSMRSLVLSAALHSLIDREHQAVVAGERRRGAQRENHAAGCDFHFHLGTTPCSSLTGMRRGPNGLPNFWNRPGCACRTPCRRLRRRARTHEYRTSRARSRRRRKRAVGRTASCRARCRYRRSAGRPTRNLRARESVAAGRARGCRSSSSPDGTPRNAAARPARVPGPIQRHSASISSSVSFLPGISSVVISNQTSVSCLR